VQVVPLRVHFGRRVAVLVGPVDRGVRTPVVVEELAVEHAHVAVENRHVEQCEQARRAPQLEAIARDQLARQPVVRALHELLPPHRKVRLIGRARAAAEAADLFHFRKSSRVLRAIDRRRRPDPKLIGARQHERPHCRPTRTEHEPFGRAAVFAKLGVDARTHRMKTVLRPLVPLVVLAPGKHRGRRCLAKLHCILPRRARGPIEQLGPLRGLLRILIRRDLVRSLCRRCDRIRIRRAAFECVRRVFAMHCIERIVHCEMHQRCSAHAFQREEAVLRFGYGEQPLIPFDDHRGVGAMLRRLLR
jgi:hypothetical protein